MTTINLGDQLRRIKEAVLNALTSLPGTPGYDASRATARLSLEAALDLLMPLLIEPDSPGRPLTLREGVMESEQGIRRLEGNLDEARDAISRLAREGVRVSAAEITARDGIVGERARPERGVIDPERLLWAVFFREAMRRNDSAGPNDAEHIADDATWRAVGASEGAEKTERIRAMLRAYGADD